MESNNYEALLQKVENFKKKSGADLSTEEDLSLAIMNLVSLEEHFYFTGVKTKKDGYFDLMEEVRNQRKALLAKMMPHNEGETWCISKHLLATTMRLIEVGVKLKSDGKTDEAKELFERAHTLYSLFWGLRFELINTADLKKTAGDEKPWTLQDVVSKLVNCCDE